LLISSSSTLAYENELDIVSAMRKLEDLVAINRSRCVQFRPRITSDIYYITIVNGQGCSSYVSVHRIHEKSVSVTFEYRYRLDGIQVLTLPVQWHSQVQDVSVMESLCMSYCIHWVSILIYLLNIFIVLTYIIFLFLCHELRSIAHSH
jgi:hypothetical protein